MEISAEEFQKIIEKYMNPNTSMLSFNLPDIKGKFGHAIQIRPVFENIRGADGITRWTFNAVKFEEILEGRILRETTLSLTEVFQYRQFMNRLLEILPSAIEQLKNVEHNS